MAFGGAAAVTTLFCWGSWTFMIQPMDNAVKAANRIERIFSESFAITPRISANAGVLFSQTSRAENLVTAAREVLVEVPIDVPLEDGSRPAVRAGFLAEAGIAGREILEINIRRGGLEADAKIPKAKILDLKLVGTPAVDSDKASWENLPERVRTRVLRQLRLDARKRALDDGLLAEADRELLSRVQALAAQAGCALVFESSKAP